ncbi:uncharacterized protein LOC126845137 [Adelges cooleyi]|uniref:uncharacterized protein LOC126845137 n=1 Tax=Adelges cooleyi TaxID=133065 RepID=UPI0021807903|nr:uncharacterized protein LOC126845137 [Adelges cooleyi]
MKSNASVALVAVYLFGVIVSMYSSPMVPDGGETSGTSETSNTCLVSLRNFITKLVTCIIPGDDETLPPSIRNYIINILIHRSRPPGFSDGEILHIVTDPDFLKKIDSYKDNIFISDYLKFQLDPEFIARVTEVQDQIILGYLNENSVNQNKIARDALLDITKKKLNEMKDNNELKTLENYAITDNELIKVINYFISDVNMDL